MSVNEAVKDIRERLKAIKQAVAGIEFRLSQLESLTQAPPKTRSEPAPAKRPPGSRAEAALQTEGEAEQPLKLLSEPHPWELGRKRL